MNLAEANQNGEITNGEITLEKNRCTPGRASLQLRKLGYNSLITLGRQALTALLGLATAILLARILGPGGNGLYTMAVLLPAMVVALGNLGIAPGTVYFVARKDYPLEVVIGGNIILAVCLGVVGLGVAVILINYWASKIFPGVPVALLYLASASIPFSFLQSYLQAVYQGTQNFKVYNAIALIPQAVILAVSAVGLLAFGPRPFVAVLGYLTGIIVAFGISITYLSRALSWCQGEDVKNYLKDCVAYGVKSHLSNIMTFLNYRLDMFLVNGILGAAAVGLYGIAVQMTERLWMVSQAVSTVLLPRIAELKDEAVLQRETTSLICRWVLLVSFCCSLVLAGLCPWLVPLFFGIKFASSIGAIIFLLPGIVALSASRILSNDIAARGRPEINFYVSILTITFNVIGNVILIPRMGINGASLASTISYTVDTAAKVTIFSRLAKVSWHQPLIMKRGDFYLLKAVAVRAMSHFRPVRVCWANRQKGS